MGVAARCKVCIAEARKPGITLERADKQKQIDAGLKRCGRCAEWLPRERFSKCERSADKLTFKCKECSAIESAEWRAKNPGAHKDWYAENKAARSDAFKAYREVHKERLAASFAKWARENKHIVNALVAKRNAAKKQATPAWADFESIQAFYAEAARITAETGIRHEVDHIYPLQGETVCGLHCAANLQILTKFENIQKLNWMPEEHHEARRNFSTSAGDGASGAGVRVEGC